ncbi:bifunctional alpha,alpha-trehalose-phosphate synthase (UDP-forming)/trehalose-phosphatase [Candidatus Latescibacterota bacterium]
MCRLLIVSNRLPVSVKKRGESLGFQPSPGGLATGISALENTYTLKWIGWPGIPSEKVKPAEQKELKKHFIKSNYYPVFLSQKDVDNYYSGFSNNTLWPLFHYFTQHAVYEKKMWNSYRHVNEIFCKTVLKEVQPGDIIWVHDYQLLLLPQMLREKNPDLTIGFFLHIPFPSFEVFRLLPWRKELLNGLLGSDLIGFHTYDYMRHFLSSLRQILGYEHSFGNILVDDRTVKIDAFPMGIDYEKYSNAIHDPSVKKEIRKKQKKVETRKIILSIDRLDYTKGILERLNSYELFLEKYPDYKTKVLLILVVVPSRTKVDKYKQLKKDLDERVGRINGKHSTFEWMPVWYLYDSLSFDALCALYILSDVCLVTPMRDGMNLIAKEYIATKTDGKGVLILSEMAGAAKELSESLIVNPNNIDRVADSIYMALKMPEEKQIKRNKIMQQRLKRYDIKKWADDFIKNLNAIKEYDRELIVRKLTHSIQDKIIADYTTSSNRLILLDYDGTLTPFDPNPEDAKPDSEVMSILKGLTQNIKNEVIIISGRDRNTLETWFKNIKIGLVAEHGVWIKEKNGNWELIEPLANYWKDEIRPVLEQFMDSTPGSFIEEKDYSLVWHYRKSDSELVNLRMTKIKESLSHLTKNLGIGIFEGSKVIEVKNERVNKGLAALKWIALDKFDFMLAAGDDWTDEDIFKVLPEQAYSIKIGLSPSNAKFNVNYIKEFRSLLKKMIM